MPFIGVVDPTDHRGKEDADPEFKFSLTRESHDHELRTAQLSLDFQGILGLYLMRAETWSPFRGHVRSHNAFGCSQKGVDRSDYFANRGHPREGGLVLASSQLEVRARQPPTQALAMAAFVFRITSSSSGTNVEKTCGSKQNPSEYGRGRRNQSRITH